MSPAKRNQVNRVGLWLFFFSESIVFGLLLSSRFFLLGTHREHLDQLVGLGVTVVLLLSSVSAFLGETSIENGNRKAAQWYILITIVLGVLFAAGVAYEWSIAEFSRSEAFGTVYFTMTGIHAAHVISGVGMLILNWLMLRRGRFSRESHWGVSATVMYWHFVDVVWVFFYPALYLL